ncbi:hypothetical protein ABTX62_33020 [Streptomyces sp. NPDC096046]|uniref:hypothetical protein n=1 Tax=Streptomyces sp. NPDC096046 TaxID=3155542 RepID=UPI0033242298
MVAAELHAAGLGTLLMDLLTERGERHDVVTAEHRFDIPLLGRRLVVASGTRTPTPSRSRPPGRRSPHT